MHCFSLLWSYVRDRGGGDVGDDSDVYVNNDDDSGCGSDNADDCDDGSDDVDDNEQ